MDPEFSVRIAVTLNEQRLGALGQDTDLLLELAFQGLQGSFSRVQLAARKLPVVLQEILGLTPLDPDLPVSPEDSDCNLDYSHVLLNQRRRLSCPW